MAEVLRGGSDPSWQAGLPELPAIWALTVVAVVLLALAVPSLVRFIHDIELNQGLSSTGTTRDFPADRSFRLLCLGIAGFMAIMGVALLAPGEPTLMDSKTHIARAWLWAQDLRHGEMPRWTDYWYGGMPGDLQYPPLSHILTAVPILLGVDAFLAVKCVAFVSFVACGVGFAALSGTMFSSRSAALAGGLLGGLLPPVHNSWIWDGRLPGILLLGILPWLFLATELLARGRASTRTAIALGLGIWLLVLAHIGQARPALITLFVFSVVRIGQLYRMTPGCRVGGIAGAWVLGTALAAGFAIPMMAEASWVNQLRPSRFISINVPSAHELIRLFRWTPRGAGILGPSVLAFTAIGFGRTVWHTYGQRLRAGKGKVDAKTSPYDRASLGPPAMLLLLIVALVLNAPSGRGLDLIFLGGVLAAPAAAVRLPGRFLIIAILVILCDLAPAQLLSTYNAQRSERNATYSHLEKSLARGRMFELSADASGNVLPSVWTYAPAKRIPSVGGPFIQGAPLDFRYAAAMMDTVARAFSRRPTMHSDDMAASSATLDSALTRLLRFHGVEALVVLGPWGPIAPPLAGPGVRFDAAIPGYRIIDASLVHAVPGVRPQPPPAPNVVVDTRGLPLGDSRQSAIAQLKWIEEVRPTPLSTGAVEVSTNELRLTVHDAPGGEIRIARAAYPGTRVTVDGVVAPWRPAPLGGVLVDVAPGRHTITIRTPVSPLRRFCEMAVSTLSGLAVFAWIALGWSERRRGRVRRGVRPRSQG